MCLCMVKYLQQLLMQHVRKLGFLVIRSCPDSGNALIGSTYPWGSAHLRPGKILGCLNWSAYWTCLIIGRWVLVGGAREWLKPLVHGANRVYTLIVLHCLLLLHTKLGCIAAVANGWECLAKGIRTGDWPLICRNRHQCASHHEQQPENGGRNGSFLNPSRTPSFLRPGTHGHQHFNAVHLFRQLGV